MLVYLYVVYNTYIYATRPRKCVQRTHARCNDHYQRFRHITKLKFTLQLSLIV